MYIINRQHGTARLLLHGGERCGVRQSEARGAGARGRAPSSYPSVQILVIENGVVRARLGISMEISHHADTMRGPRERERGGSRRGAPVRDLYHSVRIAIAALHGPLGRAKLKCVLHPGAPPEPPSPRPGAQDRPRARAATDAPHGRTLPRAGERDRSCVYRCQPAAAHPRTTESPVTISPAAATAPLSHPFAY